MGAPLVALYRDGRQADALHAYDEVRQVLAEQLGLEPGPQLRDLQQAVLLQDPRLDPPRVRAGAATEPALTVAVPAEPGPARSPATPRSPSAPSGPFHRSALIGRRDEVDSAVEALGSHRLVTFVGPAGVGKTRLAAEVAGLWSAESSPVRFLELSPLDGHDTIAEALAACAGVTLAGQGDTLQAVLTRLRDERGLLVLDCCEHVREAAAAVAEQVVAHEHDGAGHQPDAAARRQGGPPPDRSAPDRRRSRTVWRPLWRAGGVRPGRGDQVCEAVDRCRSPSSWRPASPGR